MFRTLSPSFSIMLAKRTSARDNHVLACNSLYNCHFTFLELFCLVYCLTCLFIVQYLILPACQWLAPFAADV